MLVQDWAAVAADSNTGARAAAGFIMTFDPEIRAAPYRLTTESIATVVELMQRTHRYAQHKGYPVAVCTMEQQSRCPTCI
jgi:hypothetical protein